MTTPPNSGSCVAFGTDTTNMSRELNFNSVNFAVEININGSAACNGNVLPWGNTSQKVFKMNFSGLNMSSQEIGNKLAGLATAINVSIAPPRSFLQSRIYVNSSAFSELNTSATLVFYGLPFSSQPNVSDDAGAAGHTSISWVLDGFDATYNSSKGNLTINVNGFSGYNVSDTVSPTVSFVLPAANVTTNPTVIINITANGTSTEISYLNISVANSSGSVVNWTAYSGNNSFANTAQCLQLSNGSEAVTCQVAPVLPLNGTYTITVTARDYGNATGNQYSTNYSIRLDNGLPEMASNSPIDLANTTDTTVAFNFTATDLQATTLNCSLYLNGAVNDTNTSVASGVATIFSRSLSANRYQWHVNCSDGINTNVTPTRTVTVDNVAPTIAIQNPATNSQTAVNTTTLNFTVADNVNGTGVNLSACRYQVNAASNLTNLTNCENVTLSLSQGVNAITVFASDYLGNAANASAYLIYDATNGTVLLNNSTAVTTNQSIVLIPSSPAANITLGSNATNASLNMSNLTSGTGTITVNLTNSVNVTANTTLGNVQMLLPSNLTISGNGSWDGTLYLPSVRATAGAAPTNSGTNTVNGVVEMGFADVQLNFSRAVRILFPNKLGSRVGYVRSGVFTEITTSCTTDSQAWVDANLAAGGDCKVDSGSDLAVWTRHFTQFVTYTNTPSSGGSTGGSGSSSNGGGSVGGGAGASATSTNPSTEYVVDIGTANCTVSVKRELASGVNLSVVTTTLENKGGSECSMADFVFADTVPDNFPAGTNEITFSPSYTSLVGWKVSFTFPSFAGGESKSITYSVGKWVPPSRVNNFTTVEMSAKKKVAAETTTPTTTPTATPKEEATTPAPGSDRDVHGCIQSAGYRWCEAKQKCLRSWEEACVAPTPAAPVQEAKTDNLAQLALIAVAILLGIAVVAGAVYFFARKKHKGL